VSDVERGSEAMGEKLLVVDDDPFIARLLEIELAAAGYQVRVANDGQQAIDMVRAHPEIGVRLDAKLRRALLHRFPFNLIYAVETDAILIISIAHHRQRPGYWTSRLTS